MKFKYSWLLIPFLGLTACDVDNTLPEIKEETKNEVAVPLEVNGLDFSEYVSVGASFTAGFSDGALFKASQENSFPNILAKKFKMASGGDFTQPLMNDNIGGLLLQGNKIQEPRLYFDGSGPARLPVKPTTELGVSKPGPYNNMGVPGLKSFHLVADGYGSLQALSMGKANPYFVRMASSQSTSILKDVLAQQPTFFTLSEIGGNDVLGYAMAGGTGVDQSPTTANPTGNLNPATYGGSDITNPLVFKNVYTQIVNALTSNNRKGVVATVPYITSLPFFTTVANNTLELDATKAAQLTGVFSAVSKLFIGGLIAQNVPPKQAQALGAQYAITFKEGKNRWIIDVPKTPKNPLGFRQMTEDELLLLTIDRDALKTKGYGTVALTPQVMQVLGKLQQGATPTPQEAMLVIGAVNGIDDKDALDSDELKSIKKATDAYNTTIKEVATTKGLALVDFKGILQKASTTGVPFDNYVMNTKFVTGGLVSLDGIHLTSRGYALMANEMLKAIDAKYGSNFAKATDGLAKAKDYQTNYSPTLR